MGDYYRGYRVIGTNADLFGKLERGRGRTFAFSDGRNIEDANFFEAVLGAAVAADTGLRVGDAIKPTHGADDGPEHDPFIVVGIVAATDTPIDRGVFVNMEGFYLQEGHAKPLDDEDEEAQVTDAPAASPAGDGPVPLPENQREVTSILVKTASLPGLPPELMSMGMRTVINEGSDGQAVLPIGEIRQLLDLFVWPLERLLLLITVLVVIVSAVGILVSMVGSSLERTRDVAIMRALGARRSHVLLTVLLEAMLLAGCGGLAGWALGHVVVGAIGPWIATNAGVSASVLSAAPGAELLLVPFLIVLAVAAGLLPAIVAYRTDVARWLQRGG
jgi:putative ABC transport system permease protein